MSTILWGLITGAALVVGTLLLILLFVGWWPVLLVVFSFAFFGLFAEARRQQVATRGRR